MKTSAAPYLEIRNPIVGDRFSFLPITFLQHCHCTFVTILFRPFARLFINLGDAHESTFPQICIHFPTCRTSILEDATFHRMDWCKFRWRNPCTAIEPFFPLGLLPLGLLFLDAFLTLCRVEDIGEGFGSDCFCTLVDIVPETAIVSFRTLFVGFPLPTMSLSSLFTLICPLILDHGVCHTISVSDFKFIIRKFCSVLLFTIVFSLSKSGPAFFWQFVQFQYGPEFLELSYS